METQKDLHAAKIVPNKQAAGIRLGGRRTTIVKHWGEPKLVEQISSQCERLEYESLMFWLTDGKVDQIGVFREYRGTTRENIGLGSTRSDVEAVYGELEWDGAWNIVSPPFGFGFDFESDMTGEQYVSGIYTFSQ